MDPLRVYLVFDQAFEHGQRWMRWLTDSLCSIGMQRDECRFGIPVHGRFKPWGGAQPGLAGPPAPPADLTGGRDPQLNPVPVVRL